MGIITRNYDFENGTTADAEQVDAEFNTIYNEFNGNISDDNISHSSFLKTPTAAPTQDYDVANKKYVDSGTIKENLLVNSAFVDTNEDGAPDWWTLLETPTLTIASDSLCEFNDNHKQVTITGAGAGSEGIQIAGGASNWLKVRPSTEYTFSIYYKVTSGDNLAIGIRSYNGASAGTQHVNVTNLNSTTAVRYSVSFTTDADATNLEIMLKANADTDVVIVSHPKLEIGSTATSYCTSNKLKQISWGAASFNLDFSTAVPATLTETNGDADQVPLKSVAFSKSDVAWLMPEFDIPITYNGGSVLVSYRFYATAASKKHTMELAFVSRGLSDAKDGVVGSFTALPQSTSDSTVGDEQICEKLLAQSEIGFVAGREWAGYLRRKNEVGDDNDEVYIKEFKIQYIEV